MNQQVIITRGLSGAGKSTWSKQFAKEHPIYKRISRDDLRFMLYDGEYDPEWEKAIFIARDALMRRFLHQGYNLVLDETFLDPIRRKELLKVIEGYVEATGAHIDIKIKDFIDVPVEECIERDMPRGKNRHVGETFIRGYYEKHIKKLLKDKGVTEWTV